jgi:hypothetical protein
MRRRGRNRKEQSGNRRRENKTGPDNQCTALLHFGQTMFYKAQISLVMCPESVVRLGLCAIIYPSTILNQRAALIDYNLPGSPEIHTSS